jgi:flavin-binding protein dodecin
VQVAELEKQNADLQAELAAGQSAIAEAEGAMEQKVWASVQTQRLPGCYTGWSVAASMMCWKRSQPFLLRHLIHIAPLDWIMGFLPIVCTGCCVQVAELEKQNADLKAELAAGQSAIAEAEGALEQKVWASLQTQMLPGCCTGWSVAAVMMCWKRSRPFMLRHLIHIAPLDWIMGFLPIVCTGCCVQVAELEKQNADLQAELAAGQSAIAEAEGALEQKAWASMQTRRLPGCTQGGG